MRLQLQSGQVGCLDDQAPSHVLIRWMAYFRLEPFGQAMHDGYHARTQSVIANMMSSLFYAKGFTRQRNSYEPSDFMYKYQFKNDKAQAFFAGLRALSEKAK